MPLASLSGSITHAVGNHGVYAVFGLLVLAAVVPVASELVMLYAGALAGGAFAGVSVHVFGTDVHSHVWGYVAIALAGTLGNLIGAAIGWWIGALGGRAVVQRWGRFIHVSEAKLDRAERWFDRYDDWAVPVGLATPLARSFVAIPAGIVRVPFAKFLALALLGCAAFCFGLGRRAGRSGPRTRTPTTCSGTPITSSVQASCCSWRISSTAGLHWPTPCLRYPWLTSRRNTRR